MGRIREAFETLLYVRLVPEFCSKPKGCCDASGFRESSVTVSERDARYFMMAWDAGLIEHQGGGQYRAPKSAASEQFFWEGPKADGVQTFTLWLEPVITVAALARLHFDFGWPKHLIGTQSSDWAFDVVTFQPGEVSEHIAGEVKKATSDVEQLLQFMEAFGRDPDAPVPTKSGKAQNAYKKVAALRARKPALFWAVGPDGLSKVFRVKIAAGDVVELLPVDENALRFVDS